MPTKPLEGGCACGQVRYRIDVAPIVVHCCHCRLCQRQTGTAFVLNALVEADHVALPGATPRRYDMLTESGKPHGIYRCVECGTAVWSEYGGVATVRFMRVGTLDDPTALAPDVHIYVRSKLPWVALPPGAKAFEAFYDPKVDLPAERLERWRAAARKNADHAGAPTGSR
jgi:hypothetical protein